ncbi:hypothetical protein Hypma_014218 [Hypsizygus marmoreus]|uniref:Uncharacterized protein n=1 Tax=Hypsizygus marmoreus TaxID=39966 RepID=A0A369JAL3_HYPMA|nr:hypothetical protein Hypma_014218 [Hypsizygus marmoreus]
MLSKLLATAHKEDQPFEDPALGGSSEPGPLSNQLTSDVAREISMDVLVREAWRGGEGDRALVQRWESRLVAAIGGDLGGILGKGRLFERMEDGGTEVKVAGDRLLIWKPVTPPTLPNMGLGGNLPEPAEWLPLTKKNNFPIKD